MTPKLVKIDVALAMVGNPSRATFYEGINAGRFPKPVKIGPQAVRWIESELADSVRQLVAARDRKAGRK